MLFHPAAFLLSTMGLMVGLQTLGLTNLALLGLALFLIQDQPTHRYWKILVTRNRWLLIVLFLVFAYGQPGEGIGGYEWTPPTKGMFEAVVHTLRLFTLLGILSSLLVRYQHEELLLGLWTLLKPLSFIGFPIERTIVRLALVLESLGKISPSQASSTLGKKGFQNTFSEWADELRQTLSPDLRAASEQSDLSLQQNFIEIRPRPLKSQDYAIMLLALTPLLYHVALT